MASQKHRSTRRAVIRSAAIGTAVCLMTAAGADVTAGPAPRRKSLRRAAPESLGVDPKAVLAFVEATEKQFGGLHSFMLLRHGQVAAEGWWFPYAPRRPHMLFSLSKSFTSTAVGFAVSEGLLSVEDHVLHFFPNDTPPNVSDNLAAMRVKHLLTMSTGHSKDATEATVQAPDGNWVREFLAQPVDHQPGAPFVYNSAATYMLSAIVQRVTGVRVLDYLTPRLFQPLGIEGATWETCPRGINTGGWGLSVKTEDIARFGQLYLQKGMWNGKRVIPEAWVEEATAKQVSNGSNPNSDWEQGYGYQFWRCRHGAYRGDGAFGQYCIVMPQQDAVLAITSGVGDMQAVLNMVWDHLLPGMNADPLSTSAGEDRLQAKLAGLTVPVQEGAASSPTAKRVSGRTFAFEPNDQNLNAVTLRFAGNRCTLTVRDGRGEQTLTATHGKWRPGTMPLEPPAERNVAASAAWTNPDTLVVKVCMCETPFISTYTFRFDGDKVTYAAKTNVGFGPTDRPQLVGKMVA